MKELEILKRDKLEVSALKPDVRTNYLGSLMPQRGHVCYQLDMNTGMITVAEFVSTSYKISPVGSGSRGVHKKLIVKERCVYVTALNVRNAERKFFKMLEKEILKG